MTSSREDILAQVRGALGRAEALGKNGAAELEQRLADHKSNTVPKRGQLEPAQRVDLFRSMAEEAAATVNEVSNMKAVSAAVAEYLSSNNLPAELAVAPDPELDAVEWSDRPTISVRTGKANPSDLVGVTSAFAGIAETGSLMLVSGPDNPTTLNLLPDNHIVIMTTKKILGGFEDAWAALRDAQSNRKSKSAMPRTVCFVTGPSRSADIEQTLLLGAHGPRRLHIVLVNEK